MTNTDFTLYSIPTLITRNKSKEYQESVILTATSLFKFFKENQLFVDIEPFDGNGELKLDTVLKKSNVTEEGLELFKNVVDGWENYLARSTAPNKYENISRLEKGLAKIRGK
ncbi:hypothetical protein JHU04_004403 [Brenneria sp. 4F2]|nr:hypothetical protein [Brenneria bubanii]